MSNQIKEAEISELEVQNKKRNLITVTYAIFGAVAGYYVFMNTKSKKSNFYSYLIGGALVLGGGYRLLTMKKTKKRKEAIKTKQASLESGYYKPAPALLDTGAAPTTVVDLGASNTPLVKPTNTSPKDPTMIYKN